MINVAILGMGTVGAGVFDAVRRSAARGSGLEVKYCLDIRDYPGADFAPFLVHDFETILNDPEVKIVAETIGGATFAYDYTKRLLSAGKSVVTSNKELVATHGAELLRIATEQNANYMFEASVGGGIPLLRPLCQCLRSNRIDEIHGILNGTTNFILTRMNRDGVPFEEAMREAQALGYAEADPTDDVRGKDALRKICILASIVSGWHVHPSDGSAEGILDITAEDVKLAASAGYAIKLLGRYVRLPDGRFAVYVAPHLVSRRDIVSETNGVFNCVSVHGDMAGTTAFFGHGAGGLATASAVVADLEDCARFLGTTKHPDLWREPEERLVADPNELSFRWFVRTDAAPAPEFGEVEQLDGGFITEPMRGDAFYPVYCGYKLKVGAAAAIRVLPLPEDLA